MSNSFTAASSIARSLGQAVAAVSAWVPTRGPTRSDDVTAEFVTAHLGGNVPGAQCEAVVSLDGTTGTTDRRRLALEWNTDGAAAGLPASVFVKSTPLTMKNRLMVAPLDMSANEVRFYRDIRPNLNGHAPKSWFTYSGPGARHILILEDLVDRGCRPYALTDDCSVEHARAVLVAQASLHAAMWASPRLSTDLRWVKRWSERPGYAALIHMYRRSRRRYIEDGGPRLTREARRLAAALDRHDWALYREMERGPLTVLHGDPHFGNTYALPNGEAGLLDWQVVWQGPGLRDVTYFLLSALEPAVRRAHERELLQAYLDALAEAGIDPPSLDEAYDRYCLFAAETFDAGCLLATWPGLQAPENVEAVMSRGLAALEDLDSADAVERAAARS
ncbi:MAG: hypothetical protein WAW17_03615 [Rhodococcus sp. (in: high G+C Gram-positive bacteria)]|uniref:hypothetical protein n=1 Tax=Rhodococcus sp. TaxID=1831 RepID=UPI003BB0E488